MQFCISNLSYCPYNMFKKISKNKSISLKNTLNHSENDNIYVYNILQYLTVCYKFLSELHLSR